MGSATGSPHEPVEFGVHLRDQFLKLGKKILQHGSNQADIVDLSIQSLDKFLSPKEIHGTADIE